jgi:alkylation response protein AidB-like acyl-CoA dehydrogenase
LDTNFSAEDLAFREEVRGFFAKEFDDHIKGLFAVTSTNKQANIEWQNKLNAKGWVAPAWPVEHGGTGWSLTQSYIFESERSLAGAPDVVPFGLKMVAPVIYTFGNDEQKAKFLPRILNSDDWWCQGYSEPGSGSDLASLKTKAEVDGDDYIVNGAKIWTTYAQHADWIFCLVRTDNSGRKQEGITFLLIDMTAPGITVNPIHSIDSKHTLNEVVFENVRVPQANRIGEQDKGWTYAKALLAHERTSIAAVPDSKRGLALLREQAKQEVGGGRPLIEDPLFQARLAEIEIELMALEFTDLRALASASAGHGPGAESSLLKLKGTEIQQSLQELSMDLAAHYCGLEETDANVGIAGHDFSNKSRLSYMYGRAATIYGGSNEVQKNITAKYILGL